MSNWKVGAVYDGPAGVHVSFEEFIPDRDAAPVPWVKVWRDKGPGQLWLTPDEWRWLTKLINHVEAQ